MTSLDRRRLAIVRRNPWPPRASDPYGSPRMGYDLTSGLAEIAPTTLFIEQGAEEKPYRETRYNDIRDIAQLPSSGAGHWATYFSDDCLFRFGLGLRPPIKTPAVVEIGTTWSSTQWFHFSHALLTGLLRSTDGFVFASSRTLQYFHEVFERLNSRLTVKVRPAFRMLPNGVDIASLEKSDELRQSFRKQIGCRPDDVVFLSFGRLAPVGKLDFEALIRTWSQLPKLHERAILLIAGAVVTVPDFREYVQDLHRLAVSLGIGDRVVIVADPYKLWHDAKQRLMSGADVFIHTTRGVEETMSLVVLEAMSHGLPSVVSNWSGLPEAVRDGMEGIVIPVKVAPVASALDHALGSLDDVRFRATIERSAIVSSADIVSAVVTLTQSRETRTRMSAAARSRAIQDFSLARVSRLRWEFMQELAEQIDEVEVRLPATLNPGELLAILAGDRSVNGGGRCTNA